MGFKFYLKVLFMVGSLGLVIYGIQTLRSQKFNQEVQKEDSALSVLLGSDARPMNWCALETQTVNIYDVAGEIQRTLTDSKDLSAVCEILIGPITKEAAERSVFAKRMVAKDAKGAEKVLEQAPGTPYFRTQGLPFSSPMLEKALQRLSQP
ncbi:MAG: hypothetical protein J7501_07235 [Bdellovibrio sp.]|nr:hypothetical protein [Bdellovibrio sp.]